MPELPNTRDRSPHAFRETLNQSRLWVSHRSRHVPSCGWSDYDGPIAPDWHRMADEKGFRIVGRIRDRFHLTLECRACGAHTAVKLFALRDSRPRCGGCAAIKRQNAADGAKLVFLRRDPQHHKYGVFRAPCGHDVRRQFGFVEKVRKGEADVKCRVCLIETEKAEALAQGWERVGPDPDGKANYRLYRHRCGHHQRVARVNMRNGQCDCAACGESWSSKPSVIYLARIQLSSANLDVVKLGYSANPKRRFRHQLGLSKLAKVTFLRLLPMPTGHDACAAEKQANASLVRDFPDGVVPIATYSAHINVVSEIYRPALIREITTLMDQIKARLVAADTTR
ncbi:MAG: hypothetical protein HLUCCA05_13475 [Roseibaca calidilacus]|uniref:Uncharacterized protein n=1 Tax=Roseibaca calidilacus TaxID=1666912 RepID=A0A0N8K716_9RHOB|nr:hypothetical protein [Roseibaca calidilacus]KPP90481.1 MAG: hypothetical protein HLUCCA05_13475 [Roseibaca calidilacus]CUX83284.1 hypothetical protein Ga0058931_2888 [Roseibaca calidilacus]